MIVIRPVGQSWVRKWGNYCVGLSNGEMPQKEKLLKEIQLWEESITWLEDSGFMALADIAREKLAEVKAKLTNLPVLS